MEKAVEHLEAMFQKADSDVNNLSQRLKFEFENNDEVSSNPAQLVQRISDVKKEYSGLVQQAADIAAAQQEAMGEFRGHIGDICQLLQKLQDNTGIQSGEKPEELIRLEQLLGSEIPWGSQLTQSSTPEPDSSQPVSVQQNPGTSKEETAVSDCAAETSPLSRRQRTDDEFLEVSQSEFDCVSELVRGRVKLTEVNSTYRILWEHFKANKKCKSVAPTEMFKLGLKVSGVTGQAKLKVLRAIKLINLSTKGDVSLPS